MSAEIPVPEVRSRRLRKLMIPAVIVTALVGVPYALLEVPQALQTRHEQTLIDRDRPGALSWAEHELDGVDLSKIGGRESLPTTVAANECEMLGNDTPRPWEASGFKECLAGGNRNFMFDSPVSPEARRAVFDRVTQYMYTMGHPFRPGIPSDTSFDDVPAAQEKFIHDTLEQGYPMSFSSSMAINADGEQFPNGLTVSLDEKPEGYEVQLSVSILYFQSKNKNANDDRHY